MASDRALPLRSVFLPPVFSPLRGPPRPLGFNELVRYAGLSHGHLPPYPRNLRGLAAVHGTAHHPGMVYETRLRGGFHREARHAIIAPTAADFFMHNPTGGQESDAVDVVASCLQDIIAEPKKPGSPKTSMFK